MAVRVGRRRNHPRRVTLLLSCARSSFASRLSPSSHSLRRRPRRRPRPGLRAAPARARRDRPLPQRAAEQGGRAPQGRRRLPDAGRRPARRPPLPRSRDRAQPLRGRVPAARARRVQARRRPSHRDGERTVGSDGGLQRRDARAGGNARGRRGVREGRLVGLHRAGARGAGGIRTRAGRRGSCAECPGAVCSGRGRARWARQRSAGRTPPSRRGADARGSSRCARAACAGTACHDGSSPGTRAGCR
jgi:hypothetical protein